MLCNFAKKKHVTYISNAHNEYIFVIYLAHSTEVILSSNIFRQFSLILRVDNTFNLMNILSLLNQLTYQANTSSYYNNLKHQTNSPATALIKYYPLLNQLHCHIDNLNQRTSHGVHSISMNSFSKYLAVSDDPPRMEVPCRHLCNGLHAGKSYRFRHNNPSLTCSYGVYSQKLLTVKIPRALSVIRIVVIVVIVVPSFKSPYNTYRLCQQPRFHL